LTLAGTNTTLPGSRLTQVFVEVRPKSTLRMVFPEPPAGLLAGGLLTAFIGVDANGCLFMGIAALFIGVAAEGWSVMKAPSSNLTVKSCHAHLTKMRATRNSRLRQV
jgi:hypothetical protein